MSVDVDTRFYLYVLVFDFVPVSVQRFQIKLAVPVVIFSKEQPCKRIENRSLTGAVPSGDDRVRTKVNRQRFYTLEVAEGKILQFDK